MHPQPQIQNSITTMDAQDLNHDLDDHEHSINTNDDNHLKTEPVDRDLDRDHDYGEDGDDLDEEDNGSEGENQLSNDQPAGPLYCTDNNPPESFSICQAKVADWLDHHTFIERKTSVKFAVTKYPDSTQTGRSSHHRSVSLNQRPKLSIIGFRKKQTHQTDGKLKNSDKPENIRLFRNRSEPGRDYCLLITEPVSPRVSCVGRVGSVRVRGRKAGVWRSVKAAFSNLVQTNRVMKIGA